MTTKRLIASVVLACVLYVACIGHALAQPACPAITTTPTAARDEVRLQWVAPTVNEDGTALGTPLTYRVYRATGTGAPAVQCQTAATRVSVLAQPVGVQNYTVTVQYPSSLESIPSNVATKTILAPRPNPPTNLTLLEQLVAWIKSLFTRWA